MPNSPVRTAVLVPVLICIDIRTDYRSCMKTKRTDLARDDGGTSKAMIYDERFVLKTFRTVHNFVLIIICFNVNVLTNPYPVLLLPGSEKW